MLVFSGNVLLYPAIFMGIIMAGGIFTGANPTYVARELAHQLKDSEPRFMVSTGASLEVALDAAATVGFSKENVFIFDDDIFDGVGKSRLGVKYWDALVASHIDGSRFQWAEIKDPKTATCVINYSSGTTGLAKGVEITHYNYMAASSQMISMFKLDPDHDAKQKIARGLCVTPYDPRSIYLLVLYSTYILTVFKILPRIWTGDILRYIAQARHPSLHNAQIQLPRLPRSHPKPPHHRALDRAPHHHGSREAPRG